MTRTLAALLVALGLAAPPVHGRQAAAPDSAGGGAEPGSELRVWLLTAGPGDAVWERFGHNALRVLDTATGRDVAYNWGIFDFDQVGFIPRFLQGRMLYMMAPFPSGPMVQAYASTGRELVQQELALTPAQKRALQDYAEWNALPANRDYPYDYFRDNCSTRVRDVLDRVLGGLLSEHFVAEPSGSSYRDQIRRLTRDDPLLFTGMDVLLGTPGDRPISVWEEMFLPMTLRDAVRGLEVAGPDGTPVPLVLSEEILATGTRGADPQGPPSWWPWYLLLGAALGAVLAWGGRSGRAGRAGVAALAALWSLVAGVVGTILVLVLFTDHVFMYGNENLLLLNPLSLALVVLVPLASGRPRFAVRAEVAARLVLAAAVLAVFLQPLPWFRQENAIFLALAVPAHAGLWWGLRRGRAGT